MRPPDLFPFRDVRHINPRPHHIVERRARLRQRRLNVPNRLYRLRVHISHANNLLPPTAEAAPIREELFTEKTYHDSFDPARAIRTKEYSYIENYAPRHLVDLPLDVQDSPSGKVVALRAAGPRPPRELYDLLEDPTELNNLLVGDEGHGLEAIVNELALRLHQWRQRTGDEIPWSSPAQEP